MTKPKIDARMEYAESILRGLPKTGPTIAINLILGDYQAEDREEVLESIQAYADIRARQAIFVIYEAARATADHIGEATEKVSATGGQNAFALQALVAAGHVSQAKVDEALSIAAATPGIRATADHRDRVIELCAEVCDEAEVAYNIAVRKETASYLALMIRALKSQQDAAIESKEGA
jgi:hypothetical protein